MRPGTFDAHLGERWSEWVLDYGLPERRGPDLGVGESVPVACWASPTAGAVAHIRRTVSDRHGGPVTEHQVDQYVRVDGRCVPDVSSAGGWEHRPPLARVHVPPGHVALDRKGGSHRGTKALWGLVGADAAVAEVQRAEHVVRRPVEAPVGLFVVCADYAHPFTVRLLDADDRVLAEIEEPAGFEGGVGPHAVRGRATLRERLFGRNGAGGR